MSDTNCTISEKPQIQQQIDRTVKAFSRIDGQEFIEEAQRELDSLKKMAGDERVLVQQLTYYKAHPSPEAGDLAGTLALLILARSEITDSTIVAALAPCLDAADPELAREIRNRFRKIDNVSERKSDALNPPNYRVYQKFIENRLRSKKPVPDSFISYIYRQMPALAIIAFLEAYEKTEKWPKKKTQPLLWAEHVISDAIWCKENGFAKRFAEVKPQAVAELEKLSEHEAWWVRLYSAEIVQKHPEFRTDAVMDRLREDPHELIRNVIARDNSQGQQ